MTQGVKAKPGDRRVFVGARIHERVKGALVDLAAKHGVSLAQMIEIACCALILDRQQGEMKFGIEVIDGMSQLTLWPNDDRSTNDDAVSD